MRSAGSARTCCYRPLAAPQACTASVIWVNFPRIVLSTDSSSINCCLNVRPSPDTHAYATVVIPTPPRATSVWHCIRSCTVEPPNAAARMILFFNSKVSDSRNGVNVFAASNDDGYFPITFPFGRLVEWLALARQYPLYATLTSSTHQNRAQYKTFNHDPGPTQDDIITLMASKRTCIESAHRKGQDLHQGAEWWQCGQIRTYDEWVDG